MIKNNIIDEVEIVNVSKTRLDMLNLMTKDLLQAEEYLNKLGIGTRLENDDDKFRNMKDILDDIVKIWNK